MCALLDEKRNVWSGFITKNLQNRVGVDAILLSGKLPQEDLGFNFNISCRVPPEEALKSRPAG